MSNPETSFHAIHDVSHAVVTIDSGVCVEESSTSPCRDCNGIVLFAWSHPLKSPEDRCGDAQECKYTFPCFAMAQIESRMAIASYGSSMAFYAVFSALHLLTMIGFAVTIEYLWMVLPLTPLILLIVGLSFLIMILTEIVKARIVSTRMAIRAAFDIPGDKSDDRSAVTWHPRRVIRQMARHLQCDNAKLLEQVDTLPEYTQ
ncbi:hypothetical protein FI667_g7163, partial [Globisporangium splendens]